MLGGLLAAAVDDRPAGAVDHARDLVPARQADAGDEARERPRDVVEGVVIVVADDHPPRTPEPAAGTARSGHLDCLIHRRQDRADGATVQLLHEPTNTAPRLPERDRPWMMRTYAGHSTAQALQRALPRATWQRARPGLSVAFDLPTQTGYDPDDELARGEVGKVGVPISHRGDMARADGRHPARAR